MPLVPAKCPECGGNVVVDDSKDAWVCDFCKTPFIVEKAITTFNTTYDNRTTHISNITNNNDIKASVVNVYENKSSDFVIKAGELIEYNGASMDVIVPNDVVAINSSVFSGSNIHSIIIPDSVGKVGAFNNCKSLETVKLPKHLDGAAPSFAGCTSLKKIILPEGLIELGENSFSGCESMESIVIPDSVSLIGERAFAGCKSMESIVIPDSVSLIGKKAFAGCKSLIEVVIPDSVTSIQEDAFSECEALEKVSLPVGLSEIQSGTFSFCRNLKSIKCIGVERVGDAAFFGCVSLKKLPEMPNVKEVSVHHNLLGNDSFPFNCERGAFEWCTGLEEIVLNGNAIWGRNCFKDCTNLKRVKITSSTALGKSIFSGCLNLYEVDLENIREVLYEIFPVTDDVRNLCKLFDEGSEMIRKVNDFYLETNERNKECYEVYTATDLNNLPKEVTQYTRKLIISGNIRHINTVLSGKKLEEIILEEGVQTVDDGTLEGHMSLKKVSFADSITSINKPFGHDACRTIEDIEMSKAFRHKYWSKFGDQLFFSKYYKRIRDNGEFCLKCGGTIGLFGRCKSCGKYK